MAIDCKSPSAVALNQGIKAVVHGPAGAGKTALCTTGKEPTLLVSAEAGVLSIRETKADIKIVETKTIQKTNLKNEMNSELQNASGGRLPLSPSFKFEVDDISVRFRKQISKMK